jgi:hypothetical protein
MRYVQVLDAEDHVLGERSLPDSDTPRMIPNGFEIPITRRGLAVKWRIIHTTQHDTAPIVTTTGVAEVGDTIRLKKVVK